ncbi:tRNA pseudouridine(55) synthase TruB [[Acholeplasma] multilocale]|uniref:tRNA pseudouridine(55) synthase TruB n=1 Tax=[Acholeplasma] multilocale TaxID=264638 RepID=UPI00040152F8|nr:tRNA pseudouridine(55) synthase TruB [[Acholeplasma] multilocale]
MNKSGIIIIDKPTGMSTNTVIQKVKRNLGIKKVGHAGTLDPLATGVVICLINNGTKVSDYLLNMDKEYLVTMKLFTATDSYDSDGEVTESQKPFEISLANVEHVVKKYNGLNYNQTPPIYSAIKVNGKKLYEYAREGKEVEVKKRNITINELELVSYNQETNEITLRAACSKGTYIRSLIVDIAADLGTVAHVTMLRRVKSGQFSIEHAVEPYDANESNIINLYETIKMNEYPIVVLDDLRDVNFGKKIILKDQSADVVFIGDADNNIAACYEREKDSLFKCKRGGLNN